MKRLSFSSDLLFSDWCMTWGQDSTIHVPALPAPCWRWQSRWTGRPEGERAPCSVLGASCHLPGFAALPCLKVALYPVCSCWTQSCFPVLTDRPLCFLVLSHPAPPPQKSSSQGCQLRDLRSEALGPVEQPPPGSSFPGHWSVSTSSVHFQHSVSLV